MSTVISTKPNSLNFKETEESMHNLFKPLVLNQRLMRHSESDITTITNTSLPISVNNNDPNIPLIYPQFQLGSLSGLKTSPQLHPFIYPENQTKKLIDIKNKPCCSCNKTKCIKKYCECFANNRFCVNCLCLDCRNKDIFIGMGEFNSEKNKNKLNRLRETNYLFSFLVFNTFVFLVLLMSILKPLEIYKKYVVKFFDISFTVKNIKIKVYHILFFILGLYISLYIYLKMAVKNIVVPSNLTYIERMKAFDQKWVIESEIWMTFLIIICILTIYRNANLFNKENQLKEKIEKIDEQIKRNETNKTS